MHETKQSQSEIKPISASLKDLVIQPEKVKSLIRDFPSFSELAEQFPVEFVVQTLLEQSQVTMNQKVGELIREHAEGSSIFVNQVLFHERVEFAELLKMGYSESSLANPKTRKREDYEIAHTTAKYRELELAQYMAQAIIEETPSKLEIIFALFAISDDFGLPSPPYEQFAKVLRSRIDAYGRELTIEGVTKAISMYRIAGDPCNAANKATEYAAKFLDGEVAPWGLA